MTPQQLGFYAQVRFAADALRQGLRVFSPAADFAHVDCVVEATKGVYRVQIKATTHRERSRPNSWQFALRPVTQLRRTEAGYCRRPQKYPKNAYDILAVWLDTPALWVFMDEAKVGGRNKLTFTPGHRSMAKTNNWEIFR